MSVWQRPIRLLLAVFVVGAIKADYIRDVHPVALMGLAGAKSNPVLGFAMAVGNATEPVLPSHLSVAKSMRSSNPSASSIILRCVAPT